MKLHHKYFLQFQKMCFKYSRNVPQFKCRTISFVKQLSKLLSPLCRHTEPTIQRETRVISWIWVFWVDPCWDITPPASRCSDLTSPPAPGCAHGFTRIGIFHLRYRNPASLRLSNIFVQKVTSNCADSRRCVKRFLTIFISLTKPLCYLHMSKHHLHRFYTIKPAIKGCF